jgi:hypothetical protein
MIRPVLVLALLLPALISCDRAPRRAVANSPGTTVVQFAPITQLTPNRIAHVAVDSLNNVYFCVETDQQQDGVIVAGQDSQPRATQLTTANILAAMGEKIGGNGTIQDIVSGPNGTIYFLFVGGKGRAIRACIGQFLPRSETIKILFNTDQLNSASGMGASLDLARGSLEPVGGRIYLFLRHSDVWGLFSFDARGALPGMELTLPRAFDRILAGEKPNQLRIDELNKSRYEFSAGPGADLLLMDRTNGQLWQVDPLGKATLRTLLAGLPSELSEPLVVKQDHLLFFAAESDPIALDVNDVLNPKLPHTTFPALIELASEEFTATGRDDFRVPSGFPGYAMRIHKLIPAPDGSMVGYDLSSGQLMRIRWVTERN